MFQKFPGKSIMSFSSGCMKTPCTASWDFCRFFSSSHCLPFLRPSLWLCLSRMNPRNNGSRWGCVTISFVDTSNITIYFILSVQRYTGLSKKVPAKFSDPCYIRADGLCIGCPKLVGSRKAGYSNMQELFCSTLYRAHAYFIFGWVKECLHVQ